ncbi:glycosyltransferase family 4 protein [Flexistipes sinusarabici]|nr:glycosyltransferase family 4 protein [Flexistipes sinusarabici]
MLWHLFDIYNFSSKKILSRYLDKLKPDVVICHNIFGWSPSIWSTCKEYNVPTVQVLHDQNLLCPRNMFKNNEVCKKRCLICKLMRMPHKKLSNKITGVVGVSKFILNKFVDYEYFIDASVKEVIYNSRNLSLPNLEAKKSRETVNFGYIGNIALNKGVENLLIAFHKINNKNIKLFVAGNGDKKYLSYLKKRYYCDNIYFLGYVKPEDFFSQIDVTVVPSIWEESLGVVVIESFAYGVPVIGSRIGGIPEMIDENVNGLLFDSVSVEDLSNKMLDFLHSISYWRNNRQVIQKSSEPFLNYWKWIEKWENLLIYIKDMD